MMNKGFSINENEYIDYLRDGIIRLKNNFLAYSNNKTDINYLNLKEAIYYLSCDLKSSDVKNAYDANKINEIKNYIWGLLLDD